MIISDSAVQLYSERTAAQINQRRESLSLRQGEREPKVDRTGRHDMEESEVARKRLHRGRDRVALSSNQGVRRRQLRPADMEMSREQELETDLNVNLLRSIFERLTGRSFQVIDPAIHPSGGPEQPVQTDWEEEELEISEDDPEDYQLAYDYQESHYEYEKTEVAASGVITTADGRQIDFSMSLSMSREFYSEQNFQLRSDEALKDPLAVNFAGNAAELTRRDFQFDIDADGHKDQIAFATEGSGFLALDKNGDGVINDGSELFGAISGNGFQDLAAYDSDGNNWIDENDDIFDRLRIWSRNSAGDDQLIGLGKAGVGALYLGHIESLFSIKDVDNSLLGQITATGLAVMESGEVVSMQQLDLVA